MSMFEKNILDRQFYKRERISKRSDTRLNERFELNMIKHEQERRKKQKYKELVSTLFRHQAEFFEFHRRKYKNIRKRGSAVKMYIENLEKKRNELMDKAEKERIKVLKNEGLDKYMEFIK